MTDKILDTHTSAWIEPVIGTGDKKTLLKECKSVTRLLTKMQTPNQLRNAESLTIGLERVQRDERHQPFATAAIVSAVDRSCANLKLTPDLPGKRKHLLRPVSVPARPPLYNKAAGLCKRGKALCGKNFCSPDLADLVARPCGQWTMW